MEYRNLGKTGIKVSELCLGTMMFGDATSEPESVDIINAAMDAGINFLDTADKYGAGASEQVVGKAIKGFRDRVILATKCGIPTGDGPNQRGGSRKHIRLACEASLRRLGTDYIDLYYLHVPDATTPIEETLSAMDDLVRQGKILYAGCSNFWTWQVMEALGVQDAHGLDRLVAVQPLYNLCNRDCEVELLPMAEAMGLGVVSYSPLARGVLTGKYQPAEEPPEGSRAARGNVRLMQTEYREANFEIAQRVLELSAPLGCRPSQLALAWVLSNELVTAPIIGPRTMEQFRDNIGALHIDISEETAAAIDELVPPGEHAGKGYRDPSFPVLGRRPRSA